MFYKITGNYDYNSENQARLMGFAPTDKFTFTVVKNGDLVKMYINGVLMDESEFEFRSTRYDSVNLSNSHKFAIRAYNRALTYDEIKNNFVTDNSLYDIETPSEQVLEEYTFGENDLIQEFQSAVTDYSPHRRNVYTLGTRISASSYDVNYVRSVKSYPFYTSFSQIELEVGKYTTSDKLVFGLTKELPSTPYNNTMDLSMFDTYIEIPGGQTTTTEPYVLKPTTYGDYYLVVMSNATFAVNGAKFSIAEPVKEVATYSGNISSTTRNGIYNAKGAYLDIEEAIINVNSENYHGIDNYGTITLGEKCFVNNNIKNTVGLYNYNTGDILDGSGTFTSNILQSTNIQNNSNVDTGFGGYKARTIVNNSTIDVTISDINSPNCNINHLGTGKLTIKDSDIYRIYDGTASSSTFIPGDMEINNTHAYMVDNYRGDMDIIGSNIDREVVIHDYGTVNADNSDLYSIRAGGSIQNDNPIDATINDSTIRCEAGSYISQATYNLKNVTLTGNTVISPNCSAGVMSSETITMGEDDNTVSTISPKTPNRVRLRKNFSFFYLQIEIYFYDGQVNAYYLDDVVKEIPEGYELVLGKDDNDVDVLYLGNDEVAQIGNVKYNSLAAAVAAVPDNTQTTITVLKDIYNVNPITISENQNIVVDYNGNSVNAFGEQTFINNGILTLDDLSGNTITGISKAEYIENNGTLTYRNVYGGSITNNGTANIYSGTVKGLITNNSTLNISGGTFNNGYDFTVENTATGHATIDDGDFAKGVQNYGDLDINGGLYNSVLVKNESTGDATINNLDYSDTDYRPMLMGSGTITINDSMIQFYNSAYNTITGTLTINDSEIYSHFNSSGSGTISIVNTEYVGGLKADDTSTINITNSNISYPGLSNVININNSANLNMYSGSVTVSNGVAITNTGNGTLVFGVKDGDVSKTSPQIKGGTNGLKNTNSNSTVKFYDGIFTGPVNNSITGTITELETGYEVITIDDAIGESKILSGDPLVKNARSTVEYDNLQSAIDEAQAGDELDLLRDLTTLSSYHTVTVGSTKEITLDTKGFNIAYNGSNGSFIDNAGALSITDSGGTTIINNNTQSDLISNTGQLDIELVSVSSLYNTNVVSNSSSTSTANIENVTLTSQSASKAIYNEGTMTITSSTIQYTNNDRTRSEALVKNLNNMTINDSTITKTIPSDYLNDEYVIYNNGTMLINEGTVSSRFAIFNTGSGTITLTASQDNKLNVTGNVYGGSSSSYIMNKGTFTIDRYKQVYLTSSASFTLNDGLVYMPIQATETSNIILLGGTVDACDQDADHAIIGSIDTTITMGTKDGNIDTTTPVVKSSNYGSYGINTSGTLNIYDGYVQNGTNINLSIDASTINKEDNSNLFMEELSSHKIKEYLKGDNIVLNVEQNKEYVDFQEAISEVGTNETLQLLLTGVVLTDDITIPSGKTFKLDFNNKNIYFENITNNGSLELLSNASSKAYGTIINNNDLVVNGIIDISKINNQSSSTLDIKKGQINNLVNRGTVTFENGNIYYFDNRTTLNMSGGILGTGLNSGYLTISGGTLTSGPSNSFAIENTNRITITDATCNSCTNLIHSRGTVNISGGNYTIIGGGYGLIDSSLNARTNITGGNFSYRTGYSYGTIARAIVRNDESSNNSIVTIKNITTDCALGTFASSLTLENVNVNSNTNNILVTRSSANVTIKDDVSIVTTGNTAVENAGKLTFGTKDSNVSITAPVIKGDQIGLKNLDTATFKFYDGVISGKTSAINGVVSETETDYSVKITDDGTYKNAFLKTTADIEKVVVVNNINYDTIQAAVNAVEENKPTNMILYTNYTLEDNIVVPANKTIEFYLNGFTINYGSYAFTGEGTVNFHNGAPTGVGGAIYRFFANITGTEINPKDIVIYQMDNGEELSPATTYKLYKLMDGEYKVVRVKENEIGDYSLGAEKEILRTTTGQINIKGIGEGTYKLVGSDSKELTFDINENSVSSNIRVDRYSSKAKQTIHVVATLILTLQTGVIRNPYILILTLLIVIIIGFITYKIIKREE